MENTIWLNSHESDSLSFGAINSLYVTSMESKVTSCCGDFHGSYLTSMGVIHGSYYHVREVGARGGDTPAVRVQVGTRLLQQISIFTAREPRFSSADPSFATVPARARAARLSARGVKPRWGQFFRRVEN